MFFELYHFLNKKMICTKPKINKIGTEFKHLKKDTIKIKMDKYHF